MTMGTETPTTRQKSREDVEIVAQLKACAQHKDLIKGGRIHLDITRKGILRNNVFVGSALVHMYAKCGALLTAQKVLNELPFRNVVSWNGLIAGYAQHGLGEQALTCFDRLLEDGLSPNARTFTCVLNACGSIGAIAKGKEFYADIIREGLLGFDLVLGNAVIDMLGKFGALRRAYQVFDELRELNIVSWNTLIAGYCQHGHFTEALKCLEQMKLKGFFPDAVTFSCIVAACGDVEIGIKIHDEISRSGLLAKGCVLHTALVCMYAKCGALAKAQETFDELSTHDLVSWTALITVYCQHNHGELALDCFGQMKNEGLSPDAVTFANVLKACGSIGAIDKGLEIHAEVIREGLLGKGVVLCSALVDMYMKCGKLTKSQQIFDDIPSRDVISWTVLISGYCQHGHSEQALERFEQMKHEGLSPDAVIFACILRACSSMEAVEKGQIYFNSMSTSYGIIPTAEHYMCMADLFGQVGDFNRAMELLEKISFSADVPTWLALMRSCQRWRNVNFANLAFKYMMCLHKDSILARVYMCDIYAAAGMHEDARRLLAEARQVLDRLSAQDVVSWNILITGYCRNGYDEGALQCFEQMKQMGLSPDPVTFACALKACSNIGAREKGKEIHADILREGISGDATELGNSLVGMYAKCGELLKAERIFHDLPAWNCISWNALITGYSQHGHGDKALACFEQMKHEGIHPDAVTFACALNACGSLGATKEGEQLHVEVLRNGLLGEDIVLGNALMDMYAKCGFQTKAQQVFDELPVWNVVSWNTLITGYCQHGYAKQAFRILEYMKCEGLSPNSTIFSALLKVCGSIKKWEHFLAEAVGSEGLLWENNTLGDVLVSMYARHGALAKAQQVLNKLPVHDVGAWNGLIAGYCQHGYDKEAVACFELMKHEGIAPNVSTFTCILKACGRMATLEMGREVHNEIVKEGLLGNHVLGSALVDMYMKCGELAKARELFDHLPIRNVVAWTALMAGYYRLGHGEEALNCLEQMKNEGILPDSVTLSCLLKACASIGGAEKAKLYMGILKAGIGLIPTLEYHTCLVNLLSHGGQLAKAVGAMKKMPVAWNLTAWFSVLCASQNQGNVDLGRVAFEHTT